MPFQPSSYQIDLFDFIEYGAGDCVVEAVAGSGKTTSLVEGAKRVPGGNCAFFAFNKPVVEELSIRLAGTGFDCKTLNGLGHGALMNVLGRNLKLDSFKYKNIADQMAEHVTGDRKLYVSTLTSWASYCQSSLAETPEEMYACAEHSGVDFESARVSITDVVRLLTIGEEMAREQKIISFDEQIWLPNKWDLSVRKYDFIFVDECQDLSKGKLELVLRARSAEGRIVFVGDPAQAIYGFAGADAASFRNIIARTQARVLPLSVCYRCPSKVIALAQEIVPGIRAAENAIEGVVETINETNFFRKAAENDLVLCRLTAPLVKTCLQMIGQGIAAKVRGREIGKQIAALIRDIAYRSTPRVTSLDAFSAAMDTYATKQMAKLASKKNSEKQMEALNDKLDAIQICWENTHGTTVEQLCAEIEALFSDGRAAVQLSTIHKAKGLEAERVFILAPKKLPLVWKGQQAWEFEQEMNLKYVALTRAQRELYFVQVAA